MQIKLAKYVDGKFEEFLELGKDFGYYGNFIACKRNFLSGNEINFDEDGVGFCCDLPCWVYKKDEKDPLGRFNGLFDGRTYGDGTFVLIRSFKYKNSIVWEDNFDTNYLVGNLHENPELLLRNRVLTI